VETDAIGGLMPILKKEIEIYPNDLLETRFWQNDPNRRWWCVYTVSRREKDLMRRLAAHEIPFYGPLIPKRYRSPQGRMRTSYIPLFPNYVFLFADSQERGLAMATNCISRCQPVADADELAGDLDRIRRIVETNVPLTPEARLKRGNRARIRSGPFAGYEGIVIRREGKTRFSLSVRFLEKGVSIEIDEALLESLH
jgi:transcription antitermination factor NusG